MKVKKLNWVDHGTADIAEAAGIEYYVHTKGSQQRYFKLSIFLPEQNYAEEVKNFEEMETAKQYAQNHFKNYILSFIEND